MSAVDWTTANQRVLVAEFARIGAQIAGEDSTVAEADLANARAAMPSASAIDMLVDLFGLSPFERDVLLLCAGVEMDGKLAALCVSSSGALQRAYATFGLALARLDAPHWSATTPLRPLRHWRLVELHDAGAVATGRLVIDERVLHFLAGINYLDTRLREFVAELQPSGLLAERHLEAVRSARAVLVGMTGRSPVIQLTGDDAAGRREVAAAIAQAVGRNLYVLSADDLPQDPHELNALQVLCSREARMIRAAFLVECGANAGRRIVALLGALEGTIFVAAHTALPLDVHDMRLLVDRPTMREQKSLWMRALGVDPQKLNGSLDVIASQYRVGVDVMARAARPLSSSRGTRELNIEHVLRSCQEAVRDRVADLTQRIQPVASWDDLVLPASQTATLRQISVHVRQQLKVYEEWGFGKVSSRGLGVSVLFAGESGTGKTLAAEVLANDLALDLYRVDLASLVSKYIGETEKNLRRVFDAAEDSGAILLFDEADALFGKRSEVNDSHDRYANIEVSYLLQRMEAYRGLAILTTNMRESLDTAFQRRLRFVVQFPFPDSSLRERIWRGIFPSCAPLGAIEYQKLARLNVAGGSIRNIALNAAFLAAEFDEALGMGHLLNAARQEAAKRGSPYSDAETRGWI
jgi:hypothetical protein